MDFVLMCWWDSVNLNCNFFFPETLYFNVWSREDFFPSVLQLLSQICCIPSADPPAVISSTVGSRQVLLFFYWFWRLATSVCADKEQKSVRMTAHMCETGRDCKRKRKVEKTFMSRTADWVFFNFIAAHRVCMFIKLSASVCVCAALCWEDGKYLTTSEK